MTGGTALGAAAIAGHHFCQEKPKPLAAKPVSKPIKRKVTPWYQSAGFIAIVVSLLIAALVLCYMLFQAEDSNLGERRSQGSFVDLELGRGRADEAQEDNASVLKRDDSVSALSEDKPKDNSARRDKKKKLDARWIHMANRIDRQCSMNSSVDSE